MKDILLLIRLPAEFMKVKILAPGVTMLALALTSPTVTGQPIITSQPTDLSVVVGSTATFTVAVSGSGPFTYQWQLSGTNLPSDIITTVAGGSIGDGAAATNATFAYESPRGAKLDGSGNLFIADTENNRIRKIDTNGVITTVAGTGVAGFSGDGGPATNATLRSPNAVVADSSGNIFIADSANNCIRKVSPAGIINTIAGNGYLPADSYGDGGPAIWAGLSNPAGMALDGAGDLFVADSYNNRVRKISTNGIITTVAGIGIAGYSGDGGPATNAPLRTPYGVVLDGSGNIFIADSNNSRIRKIDSNGIISTVAGNGGFGFSGDGVPATQAGLNYPADLAFDAQGRLYIADEVNQRIRRIATNGIITTVAGGGAGTNGTGFAGDGGAATNASLSYPAGVSVSASGVLFIADMFNNRIRQVGTNGVITTAAGGGNPALGDGGAAVLCGLSYLQAVVTDPSGNIFIADTGYNRIRKVDTNGIITTIAGTGSAAFSGDGGAATNASLNSPTALAMDPSGALLFADNNNQRIRRVGTNGIITTVAGNGTAGFSGDGGPATNASFSSPTGVAADAFGNLFIADQLNYRIRKVGTNGTITTIAGTGNDNSTGDGGPATNADVAPYGIAVGPFGDVFVSDMGNFVIRRIGTNGIISTVAAGLYFPFGVAVDPGNNLYIADTDYNLVRMVNSNAIMTTVVGDGTWLFSADGFPATNATLAMPFGVTIDARGNIFIADTYDERVREVAFTGYPWFVLNDATTNEAGQYRVIVTDPSGSVTSRVAALSILTPPSVSSDPQGLFVTSGMPASFAASASGSPPLYYTWLKNWIPLTDTANISGAATTNLMVNAATTNDAGNYTMIISNAIGTVATSNATLTVIADSVGDGILDTWRAMYFAGQPTGNSRGTKTNNLSCATGDGDGTGMSNLQKYEAGFNPTNSAAYLHIVSVALANGTNVVVTYLGASGDTNWWPGVQSRTNVLEFTSGTAQGGYTNAFWTQVPGETNILGVGLSVDGGTGRGTVTNMTDVGGAANGPSRFYRVRVLLP